MGLFVLVGFIAYILLATLIVSAIGKYSGSKIAKYAAIVVLVLIPVWDIIPGQLYFQHLCETEAGVKVFREVEVDLSYFKPDGKLDDQKLTERYPHVTRFDRNFSPAFHIAKTESTIQDKQTKEILGTAANFSHRGGWLTTFVLVDTTGASCPAYPSFGMHSAVLARVFRPNTN